MGIIYIQCLILSFTVIYYRDIIATYYMGIMCTIVLYKIIVYIPIVRNKQFDRVHLTMKEIIIKF